MNKLAEFVNEKVNVYFWQFLPAKPSYYTQLHSRNQMEADDERDNE